MAAPQVKTADEGDSGLPYVGLTQYKFNLTGWMKWVKSRAEDLTLLTETSDEAQRFLKHCQNSHIQFRSMNIHTDHSLLIHIRNTGVKLF